MAGPEVEVRDALFVTYHTLVLAEDGSFLGDDDFKPEDMRRSATGFFDRGERGAVLHTGIHTGFVELTIHLRNAQPEEIDPSWESIVEISLSPRNDLRVSSLMTEVPATYPVLVPGGGGPHRLRAHARGRDVNIDGGDFEPHEQYLVQVWPEPALRDVVVYKAADARGAELRGGA